MKNIYHPASGRGHNRMAWLDSYHSFSFGHYYNEEKMHFGALRVLNDDAVMPGMGFGKHPHDNMEIVSIPLSGALEHNDSMGNHGVIQSGDVQIMSAGTGIAHSEFNHSKEEEVRFLQIWIFPKEKQIAPRYDQKFFDPSVRKNTWQVLVDPAGKEGVQIIQDSWFSITELEPRYEINYQLHHSGNGVYFFLLEGEVEIEGQKLGKRDALGIWETENVQIKSNANSKLLAIEVPMAM